MKLRLLKKTVDDLEKEYPIGTKIKSNVYWDPESSIIETVVIGYTYSLPLTLGGPDQPALIVTGFKHFNGEEGHVYPFEVVEVIHELS